MRSVKTVAVVAAIALGAAGCGGGAAGTETDYAQAAENPPTPTDEDNQSTFAVDIDTASYEYARQMIHNGRLPDPDMVRPEEFVNAFSQDYTEPDDHGFSVSVDGVATPDWYASPDAPTHLVRVGLQTKSEPEEERSDARLTFVIDTSGSMEAEDRLPVVQDSLHVLVDQLRPGDAVALVTYSDSAEVVQPMTSAANKDNLHAAIDSLEIGGSTNVEEGLRLGYEVASEGFGLGIVNRVILMSDGLANTGSTEYGEILDTARDGAADGIALLCIGVGFEYGDDLMERLADNGDGFAVYFSTATQAEKLFKRQLAATLAVRAKDAKVQVTFDPEVVESYRLIGFENRDIADEDFTNDAVDGGEVGPGHSVTALYAVTLTEAAQGAVADVAVRWHDPETGDVDTSEGTADVAAAAESLNEASPRLGVDIVAAAFAEVLRGGEYAPDVELTVLADLARELANTTEDAEVTELADTIAAAAALM